MFTQGEQANMPSETVEVPTVKGAKNEAGSAKNSMIEGALTSTGITVGGAAVPVLGEALGGFLSSLPQSRKSGKDYANRRAAEEAVNRLLE